MIRAEDVLERITTKDGLEFYGIQFDQRGFTHCPFHREKTPSFHYNLKTDRYKCFSCGAGGNIIDFVMQHFSLRFPDALKRLDSDFKLGLGRTLTKDERAKIAIENRQRRMINAAAKDWENAVKANYNCWTDIYRYLNCLGNQTHDLTDLIDLLDEALSDFSGTILRTWPESLPDDKRKILNQYTKDCDLPDRLSEYCRQTKKKAAVTEERLKQLSKR